MTVYMDMDGCIARWNTEDTEADTHEKGYFLHREPEPELIRLVRLLKEKQEDVRILSCAYENGLAVPEKKQWLKEQALSDIPAVFVPYGIMKKWQCVEDPDTALIISDYSRELHECVLNGVAAVKFYNGINGTQKTWKGPSICHTQTAEEMYGILKKVMSA